MPNELDLKGQLLVAMPGMEDHRFARAVVLVSSHDAQGAMGFVLNQPVASPSFDQIMDELGIEQCQGDSARDVSVFCGGPVEQGRGFVIHSLDYSSQNSLRIGDIACVTATLDALKTVSGPSAPERAILCLGYAGWGSGQLEDELAQNGWLTIPATQELIFATSHERQYAAALAAIGIDEASLSSSSGHA